MIASKRLLNGVAHRRGEVDLLARDADGNIFVVELKYVAQRGPGEIPVEQLHRYMQDADVRALAGNGERGIFGILLGQEVRNDVRREIADSRLPVACYEVSKAASHVTLQRTAEPAHPLPAALAGL